MAPPLPTIGPAVGRVLGGGAEAGADPARLDVLALGAVPEDLVAAVAGTLHALHELSVSIATTGECPRSAFNPVRNQYHATTILQEIAPHRCNSSNPAVLALTDVDLFIPDLPFVFGAAAPDARSAVVSLARLVAPGDAPGRGRLRHRVLTEAVHELGHVLGLAHCGDVQCAMRQSHDVSEVDEKRPDLCAACRRVVGWR